MKQFCHTFFSTQFRALGNLIGSYSELENGQGIFTLEDGNQIQATLEGNLKYKIAQQPERLEKILEIV
ncbi:MAG: hypothetical protein QNJ54_27160 [Prochloraceae cyanobacterium]|nr:hypothetical protein [Prochloraceae cyanobacterium]